ncbi:phosphatidylinositol N-acetylglucosaminyltransferase subunit GPI1 [Quillaja saponaria]|uniref:Phosphatidylinositol N-acetylglucosaminyltransferase subunit GPI1 n=1 Tax=Quillaja saponaria TaxID=32244 RepID=A0AAD7PZW9_QUISA|nr:phosphatidylinositol N-acetylglucosaminyltransferase subunit GPI1 [Quillaja saponaria]
MYIYIHTYVFHLFVSLFHVVRGDAEFPSGIWFEIVCCGGNGIGYLELDCADDIFSPSKNLPQRKDASREKSTILVSVLHSNFLSVGHVMFPHYQYGFSRVPNSFVSTSANGILSGRRHILVLLDPEIHEELQEVVTQQAQDEESDQITRDEILLKLIGNNSGYFYGKCAEKTVTSKRSRQGNIEKEVQRFVDLRLEQTKEALYENIKEDIKVKVRAEVQAEVHDVKAEVKAQFQAEFDVMFKACMSSLFGSFGASNSLISLL